MITVAVLVACYNREASTKAWLESLKREAPSEWNVSIFAVDDNSVDATIKVLLSSGLNVEVIKSPGDWYWAKSMSVAEDYAMSEKDFDYFLWANDDTFYRPGGLDYLDAYRRKEPNSIIVGKFRDPENGMLSYGGLRKVGKHPFKYRILDENLDLHLCDNFHGNFVLVPNLVAKKIGRIDGNYQHAYADYDYGRRATNLGIRIISPSKHIGYCLDNKRDLGELRTLSERLKFVFSIKGLPVKSQIRYLRKFGPVVWLRFLLQPYIRAIIGKNARD